MCVPCLHSPVIVTSLGMPGDVLRRPRWLEADDLFQWRGDSTSNTGYIACFIFSDLNERGGMAINPISSARAGVGHATMHFCSPTRAWWRSQTRFMAPNVVNSYSSSYSSWLWLDRWLYWPTTKCVEKRGFYKDYGVRWHEIWGTDGKIDGEDRGTTFRSSIVEGDTKMSYEYTLSIT